MGVWNVGWQLMEFLAKVSLLISERSDGSLEESFPEMRILSAKGLCVRRIAWRPGWPEWSDPIRKESNRR